MMETAVKICLSLLVIFNGFCCSNCYDNTDYEIFDLVEEVNQTFYDAFALDSTASTSEIKRAYRRLAVKYHPDKNSDEGAAEFFRQIAAIYDVLKDDEKRQRYDLVLQNGLPDWRQPVFYFRRVRKLGLVELTVILTLILTVGHFLVIWASYIERKYEAEEVFRSRQRKEKKVRGRNKVQAAEEKELEFEAELDEYLSTISRPTLSRLLPCMLVSGSIQAIMYAVHTPARWRELREQKAEELRLEQLEQEEEEQRIEELNKLHEASRNRKRINLAEVRGEMISNQPQGTPVVYGMTMIDTEPDTKSTIQNKAGEVWCDEDMAMLAKAIAKFPGGTSQRWQKIAEMMGRTVKEVTAMSKNMKQDYSRPVDHKAQGITGSIEEVKNTDTLRDYSDITQSSWQQDDHSNNHQENVVDDAIILAANAAVRRRRKGHRSKPMDTAESEVKLRESTEQTNSGDISSHNITMRGSKSKALKTSENAQLKGESQNTQLRGESQTKNIRDSVVSSDVVREAGDVVRDAGDGALWSQEQQKLLELALVQHPRGTANRWSVIAVCIPGKTKDDCVNRFKYLAEVVRKRKEQQS